VLLVRDNQLLGHYRLRLLVGLVLNLCIIIIIILLLLLLLLLM